MTANGENVAGGMGLTPSTADALLAAGVDVITSGNHIWDKREIYPYLEANDRVLRPLNYGTHEVPGRGWGTYQALDGTDLAVINLQGRTYMQPIENPFTEADRLLDESSEPLPPDPAGRLPLRAHVREERARAVPRRAGQRRRRDPHPRRDRRRADPAQRHGLPDRPGHDRAGLERHRVRPGPVLPRFINALPTRFEVGEGTVVFNAVQVDIDPATGRALAIERIQRLVEA